MDVNEGGRLVAKLRFSRLTMDRGSGDRYVRSIARACAANYAAVVDGDFFGGVIFFSLWVPTKTGRAGCGVQGLQFREVTGALWVRVFGRRPRDLGGIRVCRA